MTEDPHAPLDEDDLGPREERPGPPGLIRVGTVVEQVRPIVRSLLGDLDPSDVGIMDLRGTRKPTHPGEPAEVYYVFGCAGDDTIELVWKRAVEGECQERLARERAAYQFIAGRTARVPRLLAVMEDSDAGGGLGIELLPQMALDVYRDGEPSPREIGRIARALAEFAADIPPPAETSGKPKGKAAAGSFLAPPTSYVDTLLERLRKVQRRSPLWAYMLDVLDGEGRRLDQLETVMSPGYSAPNIGFREDDPLPVFFDLDTLCARPIGSGLVTGLVLRADFDVLVDVIRQSIPQLEAEDIYFLAFGQLLEEWGAGDRRGRPGACHCLDALGIPISEEIRTS